MICGLKRIHSDGKEVCRKGKFVTVVTVGLQVCQKCDKRGKVIVIFGDKKPLNLLYITDKLSHVVF